MPSSLDLDPGAADRYRTHRQRTLRAKFRCAFRGLRRGMAGERNFRVHLAVAAAVIAAGLWLQVSLLEWCLLAICITAVLGAEMSNTAVEMLAKAVRDDYDPHVEDALDTASASVLIATAGAVVVGGTIFLHRLGQIAGCW